MAADDDWDRDRWADDGWDSGESLLVRACEVVAVAAVGAGVGLLLGGLTGVITGLGGPVAIWLGCGAIIGTVVGGLLETMC